MKKILLIILVVVFTCNAGQLPPSPVLSIKKGPMYTMTIDWTNPLSTDKLKVSNNFVDWLDIYQGLPPVDIQRYGPKLFFKVDR